MATRKSIATQKSVRKTPAASSKTAKRTSARASLGLKMFSIRLQNELVESLKSLAKQKDMGYQTYVRELLVHHVQSKKKR